MKINLFFWAAIAAGISLVNAQETILFQDDFESYEDFLIEDVGEWTILNADGSTDNTGFADVTFPNQEIANAFIVFNPLNTTPPIDDITSFNWDFSPKSGEKYMLAKFSYQGQNSDWLISPQINLPDEASEINWSFWVKAPSGFFFQESFNVWIRTVDNPNDGEWVLIDSVIMDTAKEWINYNYDITEYTNETVQLAIEYTSDNLFALLIDDFKVSSPETAGTNDLNLDKLLIYPNPVTEGFKLSYPNGKFNENNLKLKLTDLNGRTIKSFTKDDIYDVSDLTKGIYLLEVTDGKQILRTKLIKK